MIAISKRLSAGLAVIALAFSAAAAPSARAEGQLRIAEQFGITYLIFHVVRDQKLIEKHGKAAGIDINVEWAKLAGGANINDALLSGSIDIGASGVGPTLTIWDRTRGNANVKAIAALGSLPYFLLSRNPNVKTIRDFTKGDRIALPAVGVSVQSRTLQLALEKELGPGKHGTLDDITVTLSHPDATAALLSGKTEVNAHFSSPPFQYQALKDPAVHRVLNSYDVLGGPATAVIAYTTAKFRSDNPKTYAAFVAALKEAVGWINAHKAEAADTYIRVENSKLEPAFLREIIAKPEIQYKLTPERTEVYADFLFRVGALKTKAQSWKDYFFEDIHDLPGS